ncbi:MAG: hypothetical protein LHV69_07630 [Elusimicrobia bacterium]|nr:hypothetical protein [Candidatus Obscuribacterium magneticum]
MYALLKKTQPIQNEIDVAWWGPYFIPRSGQWCPSHFTIYDGTLYCRLFISPGSYGVSWKIGSDVVEFERGFATGDYYNDEHLWSKALAQIERRFKSAIKNVSAYNRFVERNLPLSCRTGKIMRRFTWPKHVKSAIPIRRIRYLETILKEAKNRPPLQQMTLSHYLDTTAIAYDAGFKELRPLSPLQKYKGKADGRHGGMLDLPPHDPEAFSKWFHSRAWAGSHPWEIVFGHPHGIMISPHYHQENRSWIYWLWVDSLGWYATAAKMAMALGEHKIPFEFENSKDVLDALEGLDEVDVGPDLYSVHFDELQQQRSDALARIQWDPIPQIALVTPDQKERIERAGSLTVTRFDGGA